MKHSAWSQVPAARPENDPKQAKALFPEASVMWRCEAVAP